MDHTVKTTYKETTLQGILKYFYANYKKTNLQSILKYKYVNYKKKKPTLQGILTYTTYKETNLQGILKYTYAIHIEVMSKDQSEYHLKCYVNWIKRLFD